MFRFVGHYLLGIVACQLPISSVAADDHWPRKVQNVWQVGSVDGSLELDIANIEQLLVLEEGINVDAVGIANIGSPRNDALPYGARTLVVGIIESNTGCEIRRALYSNIGNKKACENLSVVNETLLRAPFPTYVSKKTYLCEKGLSNETQTKMLELDCWNAEIK